MMNAKSTRNIALLLSLLVYSLQASAETYPVETFEYSGVRFGMLPEEARDAVAEFQSLDKSKLDIVPIDVNDPYPGLEHIAPLPWTVFHETNNLYIKVTFAASLDRESEGFMIVNGIRVEYGDRSKRKELQQLDYENAVNKYGPPTYEYSLPPSWEYGWCAKVNSSDNKCDRNEPSLVISNVSSRLINPKIEKEWFTQYANWPKPE